MVNHPECHWIFQTTDKVVNVDEFNLLTRINRIEFFIESVIYDRDLSCNHFNETK